MNSARHRHAAHATDQGEDNGERWLLTYADMITLLLALFIVLFAMSTINAQKFLEFKLGLERAFSPSAIAKPGSAGLLTQTSLVSSLQSHSASKIAAPSQSSAQSNAQLDRIAAEVERALGAKHLQNAAQVTVSTKAVVVQILADKAFFASDSAALGAVGNEVVDTIAGVVRKQPNDLVVEGYTDTEPITGGPYNSNWELSAVRAANVTNRLNVVDGIAARRLSAQGYGQTDPVKSNATPAGRAENRRVDVVILNTTEAP